MKKSAISLLLALAIVFSLVLVAAPAAQAAGHTDHCVCAAKYEGDKQYHTCQTLTGWTELTASSLLLMETMTATIDVVDNVVITVLPAGNYYLSEDIDLVNSLTPAEGATVTICLNGHKLNAKKNAVSADGRIFNLHTASTLNVTDCSAGNAGSLNHSGAIYEQTATIAALHNADLVFNFYAGTINAGKTSKAGGAIRSFYRTIDPEVGPVNTGIFNMYGGVIQGGQAGNGGNLGIYSDMNMYGGTIQNGNGSKGGNIYIGRKEADVKLCGGSIIGGITAPSFPCDIWIGSGNLYIINMDATFVVHNPGSGKIITDNMDASLVASESTIGEQTFITYTKTVVTPPSGGDSTGGSTTNPGTGDSANLVVMGLGLVLGVAGMACLLPKKQTV